MYSREPDGSTLLDRKVAAVAADALKDVLSHALLTNSSGVGLRGGSYRATFTNPGLEPQLHAVQFTSDVAITGRAVLPFNNNVVTARLTVDGPAGETGNLITSGAWLTVGATKLTITGTLHAHKLALAIPAT
jgi:hypothetical protein